MPPRLVLVPGFTQTASSWAGVERVVHHRCGECDVRALDVLLRNSFEDTAAEIGRLGGAGVYVGYSMGGRLCLRLALDHPEVVDALVLVSTSPGIADPAERTARRRADEDLARAVERDGVDAFLERWLAQPLFAGVPPDAPGLDDRRGLGVDHIARGLRVLGTGVMEPLWSRLGDLNLPVALVTGRDDAKFGEIAARMLEAIGPRAQHHVLPGGHALPLEQPEALGALVADFALRHGSG